MSEPAAPGGENDFAGLLTRSPFIRFLGIRLVKGPKPVFVMPFQEKLVGNVLLPALHGGAIGALLETAAIAAAYEPESMRLFPKTVDINIDYLRSARPRDLYAAARPLKIGRRVAAIAAEAWQDDPDEPIAFLRGQFLLTREGPAKP